MGIEKHFLDLKLFSNFYVSAVSNQMLSQTLAHFPMGLFPEEPLLWENYYHLGSSVHGQKGSQHWRSPATGLERHTTASLGREDYYSPFPHLRGYSINPPPLCSWSYHHGEQTPSPTCSRIANIILNQTHTILRPQVPALVHMCRLQNLDDSP